MAATSTRFSGHGMPCVAISGNEGVLRSVAFTSGASTPAFFFDLLPKPKTMLILRSGQWAGTGKSCVCVAYARGAMDERAAVSRGGQEKGTAALVVAVDDKELGCKNFRARGYCIRQCTVRHLTQPNFRRK